MTPVDPLAMTRAQLDALDWQDAHSSNVQAIAFEAAGNTGRLFVRFGPASVYRYDDVPADEHAALLEASRDANTSVGRRLHARIKPAYPCHRIELEDPADA